VTSEPHIRALDRFEPEYGKDFLAFAVPTITGRIRRYFRDRGSQRISLGELLGEPNHDCTSPESWPKP
jgi:hypothetical protein